MAKRNGSQSVQFRQRKDIIEAYESRKISGFAIWCGQQFLFDYSGDDIDEGSQFLSQWLQRLYDNKSAGIYTVAIYKPAVIPEDGIDSETPYHGSFNFRLTDEVFGYNTPAHGALESKISALEARLREFEEFEDAEDTVDVKEDDLMGKITGILVNPAFQPILMPLMAKLGAWLTPAEENKAGRISGVVTVDERIQNAVDKLKLKVSDIDLILEKLALMSEKNPITFNLYIGTFRQMKV